MNLLEALMNSQEISREQAEKLVGEMRKRVWQGENPENILYDEGLEPDYVFELID